jgi:hypothetical protein
MRFCHDTAMEDSDRRMLEVLQERGCNEGVRCADLNRRLCTTSV